MGFRRSLVQIQSPRPVDSESALRRHNDAGIGVSRDAPLEHRHYVQGYLYACEAEGKSAATVVSYAENLARFQAVARELGLPGCPQDITRQRDTGLATARPGQPP